MPREPYRKGQLIVWFVKDSNPSIEQMLEVCNKCNIQLVDFHGPERCVVGFDEARADEVITFLKDFPKFIRNASRNHYLYLC